MKPKTLTVRLLSDACFASGDRMPGEVDTDIAQSAAGLPVIPGKTLHGLLRDSWLTMAGVMDEGLTRAAERVLGCGGELEESAVLRVGEARLEESVREWVRWAIHRAEHPLQANQILATLTDVRVQTARSRSTGAPKKTTLRATRVVLKELVLSSELTFFTDPATEELRCLALAALGVRHAGLGRNRGRGHLECLLDGDRAMTLRLAGLEARVP